MLPIHRPIQTRFWGQFLSIGLLSLAFGCAGRPSTVVPATASPIFTQPDITHTPVGATPTSDANLLQRALAVLRQQASFHVRLVNRQYLHQDPPVTLEFDSNVQISVGPPEHISSLTQWPSGVEEVICVSVATGRPCWARVGQHPWSRRIELDSLSWLQVIEQRFTNAAVINTEVITSSREIVVDWQSSAGAGRVYLGRIWLNGDTLLPTRETYELQTSEGDPVGSSELSYSNYNVPVMVEAPVLATATPVASLPALAASLSITEAESALPGVLYIPVAPGPFPAVVILHGSEGGVDLSSQVAGRLARAGYVALALCYFECSGTPSDLNNVNIEVVMEAVASLQARSDVRSDAVALLGYSRGAELALVTAALDPSVRAAVAVMGSPWVNPGINPNQPAWLYQGQPVPFAAIPVERIAGPVLLLHGEQDTLWPVAFSYLLADRLEMHQHPFELVVYAGRGHDILVDPPDVLPRIDAFLERSLK